ncbi:hypothetical protein P280DRAFT_505121 [Massarina eburnea CBS 473.64]|uniref:Uncharacterized protein n=1 Tax=Massarina eburnea CBS 473.64 TaxID=1395130 RepID=A0A6A6SDP9_9PLEO|nr:hypothetical protein P280DRAFT_505121 [Massarina eburnea CBS 473.64]
MCRTFCFKQMSVHGSCAPACLIQSSLHQKPKFRGLCGPPALLLELLSVRCIRCFLPPREQQPHQQAANSSRPRLGSRVTTTCLMSSAIVGEVLQFTRMIGAVGNLFGLRLGDREDNDADDVTSSYKPLPNMPRIFDPSARSRSRTSKRPRNLIWK